MDVSPFTASMGRAGVSGGGSASKDVTLEGLFGAHPAEKLSAGGAAFWEGDPAAHVFQLIEGCLRLYRILSDGRRAIIGFRFAGETLGVSCQDTYAYTAEAVTPVRFRRISRNRLQAVGEQQAAGLQRLVMMEMLNEMRAAQRHIIVLGQLGAEERVKDFLVSVALRTNVELKGPALIELPMTRLDIADYLGLTIETVCRAMSKLKRNGIIALPGRHSVVLRRIGDMSDMVDALDVVGPVASASVPASLPH